MMQRLHICQVLEHPPCRFFFFSSLRAVKPPNASDSGLGTLGTIDELLGSSGSDSNITILGDGNSSDITTIGRRGSQEVGCKGGQCCLME